MVSPGQYMSSLLVLISNRVKVTEAEGIQNVK